MKLPMLGRSSANLATVGMILLYPGFLLYHFFSGYFSIQLPLGGFFGPVATTIALLSFVILSLRLLQSIQPNLYEFVVTVFFVYTIVWVFVSFALVDGSYRYPAAIQSLEGWVRWIAVFFAAYWLPRDISSLKVVFLYVLIAATLFLLWYMAVTGRLMYQPRHESETVASYQGLARSVCVMALLLFGSATTELRKLVIFACSLFVLFMLGSRSDLAAFMLAVFLFLVIRSCARIKNFAFWSTAAVFSISILLYFLEFDSLSDSRQFQLLNIQEASSWLSRQALLETAVNQIRDNPLFGYFGGHIAHYGSEGSYAHNIASVWVSYGLIGFLLYITMVTIPLIHSSYYLLTKRAVTSDWQIVMLFSAAVFALVIASKSVFDSLPAIAWGLYARALMLSREQRDFRFYIKPNGSSRRTE